MRQFHLVHVYSFRSKIERDICFISFVSFVLWSRNYMVGIWICLGAVYGKIGNVSDRGHSFKNYIGLERPNSSLGQHQHLFLPSGCYWSTRGRPGIQLSPSRIHHQGGNLCRRCYYGSKHCERNGTKIESCKWSFGHCRFPSPKFASNSAEVLQHIAPEHREINFSIPFADDCGRKTLGIKWQLLSDTFSFQVTKLSDGEVTKRSILSAISRLYDSIGWISPCTIKAKIIMQQLWGRGLERDKPIPSDLKQEWIAFRDDLPSLGKLNIDRHNRKIEVHGFSDASKKAYAAADYLRVLDQADQVHMHLLMSKTKAAELETITLPRLELCGAVLLFGHGPIQSSRYAGLEHRRQNGKHSSGTECHRFKNWLAVPCGGTSHRNSTQRI